jgi:xanthine dehydrogenase accessory factor
MTTSAHDVIETARRLQTEGRPYALVSVLRVQPPASARPGDKAVVTADGIACGWIGGGCAQPAVQKTVRQALADGRARMIRIAPADEGAVRELGDVLEFGMACHSGGTLELFVDPVVPRARLVIVGDSPVAAALAALAPRVGFDVQVVAHGAEPARFPEAVAVDGDDDAATVGAHVPPGAFVVVATQGRRDVQGLRAALAMQARRVWFVASARKAEVLRRSLAEGGADAAAVGAIVAPAGQPIGAQTPEEIALSVLASVVAARRGVPTLDDTAASATEPTSAAQPAPVTTPTVAAADDRMPAGGAVAEPRAVRSAAAEAARARIAARAQAAAGGSCCGGGASVMPSDGERAEA